MSQWRWFAGSSVEAIVRLEPEWRELMARSRARFMAGPTWQRAYAEAFGTNPEVRALYSGSKLAAVGVFESSGHTRSFAENLHFPVCDVAIDWSIPDIADALIDAWTDGAPELCLSRLPITERFARTLEWHAERRVPHVVTTAQHGDASISLRGGVAGIERRLSPMTRRDARTKEKRLTALGNVSFEALGVDAPVSDASLQEAFELEASGWKGREGSPISADPITKRFYESLFRYGAAHHEMALYVIKLDGRIVAFDLDTRNNGRIDLLKTGYDESLSKASPGNVLRWHILESEAQRGEIDTYHLGRPSDWKMRWATKVSDVGSLQLYSGARGRAIYLTTVAARTWVKEHLPTIIAKVRDFRGAPPPRPVTEIKAAVLHAPVLSLVPPAMVQVEPTLVEIEIEPPLESGYQLKPGLYDRDEDEQGTQVG